MIVLFQNNNNLHIFVTKTIWNYIRKTTWSDTINLLSSIILSRAAHSSSSLNGSAECSLFRCSLTFSTESDCACSLSNNRNNDALKSFSLKIHVQNQIHFQNSELYKTVCERKYPFQCRIPITTQFCTNKSEPLPYGASIFWFYSRINGDLLKGMLLIFPHDIFPGLSITIQFYIIWTCLLHHWHLYFVFFKKKKFWRA